MSADKDDARLEVLKEVVAEKGVYHNLVPGYQSNEREGARKAAEERAFWRQEFKRQERDR